jgi:hypothetical protein
MRESSSGGKLILTRKDVEKDWSPEEKKEEKTNSDEQVTRFPHPPGPTPPTSTPTIPLSVPVSSDIVPEFHFNIQIHLPAEATPDKYDAIFKSIAIHLLGRTDKE